VLARLASRLEPAREPSSNRAEPTQQARKITEPSLARLAQPPSCTEPARLGSFPALHLAVICPAVQLLGRAWPRHCLSRAGCRCASPQRATPRDAKRTTPAAWRDRPSTLTAELFCAWAGSKYRSLPRF
jgi:hypothetical protein